jgi:cytochrome P450
MGLRHKPHHYKTKFREAHMVTAGSAGIGGGRAGAASGSVSSGIPGLDIDPFAIEFFENPYPTHEALREAGPVVHLNKWNVYAVARYAEVHAVLNDPLTFCSSRGVGLSDFAKEKPWRPPSLLLETDPPAHTRTRAVLNRVLSPAVMKQIRDSFAAAAEARVDQLMARGSFDAVADLRPIRCRFFPMRSG